MNAWRKHPRSSYLDIWFNRKSATAVDYRGCAVHHQMDRISQGGENVQKRECVTRFVEILIDHETICPNAIGPGLKNAGISAPCRFYDI